MLFRKIYSMTVPQQLMKDSILQSQKHRQSRTTFKSHHNYGILKKLSWEVATLAWKVMGNLFTKRKTFPATFSHGEVWPLPEGSEDHFFYSWYISSVSLGHCIIHFNLNFTWFIYILYILKKIKRTLLKKINILTILPSAIQYLQEFRFWK